MHEYSTNVAITWERNSMQDKSEKESQRLLQGIQRNTQMALNALQTMNDKVTDDTLALQLAADSLRYAKIHTSASEYLLNHKGEPYRETVLDKVRATGSIQAGTITNTSTSHLAELLIQGNNRGIMEMQKVVNHCPYAGRMAVEMAKELMDFEEKQIKQLKNYL